MAKRDVELTIRATDLTSQPFAQVAAAITNLSAKLAEQAKAAGTGNVTARELAATMRQLKEAGDALVTQDAMIGRYEKLGAALEKAQGAAGKARGAFDAMKATLDAQGTVTDAQQRSLDGLARGATRLEGAATAAAARLTAMGETLTRAGLDTNNLAQAQAGLAQAATAQAAAMGLAKTSLDEFDAAARRHKAVLAEAKAAEEELKAVDAFKQKAADAAKLHEATEYVQFWETELRKVEATEKELAAVDTFKKTAADAAKLQEASGYVHFWETALKEAEAAEKELASVDAFKQKLAETERLGEAAKYVKFWETALVEANTAQEKEAAMLARNSALVDKNIAQLKAQTAAQHGLNTARTGATGGGAAGGANGAVFLGLKPYEVQNLSYQVNDIITSLSSGISMTQTLAQQGGQVFQIFERQLGSLGALLPKLGIAAVVIGTLVAAFIRAQNTANSIREFTAQLKLSVDGLDYSAVKLVSIQRNLQRLGADFDEAGKALHSFIDVGVRQNQLSAFAKTALDLSKTFGTTLPDAAKALAAGFGGSYEALIKLNEEFNFLSVAQHKAIRDAFDAGDAAKAQGIAFGILSAKAAESAKIIKGPFTDAWITAKNAVFDLLDLLGSSKLATLAGRTISFLADQLQNVATGLRVVLDLMPGGGGPANDPQIMLTVLEKLKKAREEAAASQFRPAAGSGMPDISGMTGADGRPMTGARLNPTQAGFDAAKVKTLAELDAQIAGLTAKLRALGVVEATSAKAAGDADAALTETTNKRTIAGDIYLRQLQNQFAAHKGLDDAARVTAKGQEEYNKALAAKVDLDAAALARTMAEGEERRLIAEETNQQAEQLAAQLAARKAQADRADKDSLKSRLSAITEEYTLIRDKIADFERHGKTDVNGVPIGTFKSQVDATEAKAKLEEEKKFNEERAKMAQGVENELASLIAQGDKAQKESLAARLDAVTQTYKKIFAKIDEVAGHGGAMPGGASVAAVKAQVAANEELLKQEETIKFYEENITEKVQQRDTIFKDLLDKVKEGTLSSGEAYRQAQEYNAKIGPGIEKLARDALAFAKALNAVRPSPQLDAFVAKTERALTQGTGTGRTSATGKFAEAATAEDMTRINQLVAARNDLAKSYAALAAKGIITQREANELTKRGYAEAIPEIEKAATKLEEFIAQEEAAGHASSALDLVKAKLKEIRAEAGYINPEFAKLVKGIEESFGNRAVEMFDKIGQSIANAAMKTQSWGQTLKDVGVAAAQMFAGILADIAKLLIKEEAQALAMEAIATIKALLHGGGVVGGSANMTRSGVSPLAFLGAPRYHGGAVLGLRSDEQAAILQNGEEVLSKDSPRNVMNLARQNAGKSGGVQNIRSVLVVDPAMIPNAMAGSTGETVVMSHIRANLPTIRQMLK